MSCSFFAFFDLYNLKMVRFEIVEITKGGEGYLISNFLFRKDRSRGNKIYLRCLESKRFCNFHIFIDRHCIYKLRFILKSRYLYMTFPNHIITTGHCVRSFELSSYLTSSSWFRLRSTVTQKMCHPGTTSRSSMLSRTRGFI